MAKSRNQIGVGYSFRRHQVDSFLESELRAFRGQDVLVLELGGRRERRRGRHDPTSYGFNLVCADMVAQPGVDVVTDAQNTCFADDTFDVVLCTEVLEHVFNPRAVLAEILRILKPGGRAFLTVPFYYQIHADPHDFGRYTESYWQRAVSESGFDPAGVTIKAQGGYFSALAHIIVYGLRQLKQQKKPGTNLKSLVAGLTLRILPPILRRVPRWDDRANNIGLTMFPHGYGIALRKSAPVQEDAQAAALSPK